PRERRVRLSATRFYMRKLFCIGILLGLSALILPRSSFADTLFQRPQSASLGLKSLHFGTLCELHGSAAKILLQDFVGFSITTYTFEANWCIAELPKTR